MCGIKANTFCWEVIWMAKARRIIYDVKTKEQREEEFDYTEPTPPPEMPYVDLAELKKLLDYAKSMGWIL